MQPNWTSIIPPLLAVILAFITRDAIISLVIACFAGVILMGQGLAGFPALITRSLGREDLIWICMIELYIGILVAFFQRCGAISMFTQQAGKWTKTKKQVPSKQTTPQEQPNKTRTKRKKKSKRDTTTERATRGSRKRP